MDFLLDPNVAYLFLVGGVLLGLLAIVSPGTGMLEVGTFFCLAAAGYAVYNLNVNWWALVVLGLSLVPFILAIQAPKRELLLALSIIGFIVGSVFLFSAENGAPTVNPILASIASIVLAVFAWIAVRKSIQAYHLHPTHDLNVLVGQVGEARTEITDEGSVQIAGELWSARSANPIAAGTPIRVLQRDGFVLVVEKNLSKS
ncbi:MAG TPA: NfeD family protein [Anaerolineales bacterium]|nr:NfeD family protein [Anaerolineales bacterium]